jgi:hypothetical protein
MAKRGDRFWLLLALLSSAGFALAVVVHNLIAALFHVEEPLVFVVAVLVTPVGAVVGALGTLVTTLRRRRQW